jgi:hypothetical protein
MVNLFQILNQFVLLFRKNVIEKISMIWRVLSLVKINTRISETPCIFEFHWTIDILTFFYRHFVHRWLENALMQLLLNNPWNKY